MISDTLSDAVAHIMENKMNERKKTDRYQIAANVALAGLDGFKGRLSAKQQREVFGAYFFGKKFIKIDASNQGSVSGGYSVCFGTDWSTFEKSFDQIATAVNSERRGLDF